MMRICVLRYVLKLLVAGRAGGKAGWQGRTGWHGWLARTGWLVGYGWLADCGLAAGWLLLLLLLLLLVLLLLLRIFARVWHGFCSISHVFVLFRWGLAVFRMCSQLFACFAGIW
jgi:hypothetical protein